MSEPTRPHVTYVNIYANSKSKVWIIADGCSLPFKDNSFDISYSNSVIEHLGTIEKQRLFATECQRVGKRLYVQTPNKWFFIEPHLITPFIHWLPRRWQRHLLRRFTVWGILTKPTPQQCDDFLKEVRLLTAEEMQPLFPKAKMENEYFLGFVKSLIFIR